jgi:hypothetical protein
LTTRVFHRAAGLTIAADRRVPGFAVSTPSGPPDVALHLGVAAPWPDPRAELRFITPQTDSAGRPTVTVTRMTGGFRFHYADGTDVWIARDASDVWCTWSDDATLEDTATYLTGPVLGFVLRLRGALALHASAVQIGEGALVLVGAHGAGKSTAAAALGVRGCPVITDDVLHLRPSHGKWLAEPVEGTLRLWNSGALLALGPARNLPRLTPTWDKRGLEMGSGGISAAAAAVPVCAVAFLEEREASERAPRLDPISPAEALVLFATHSSAAHLLDEGARAREFTTLDRLVRDVICMRAVAAERSERFGRFIDLLHDWAARRSNPDGR